MSNNNEVLNRDNNIRTNDSENEYKEKIINAVNNHTLAVFIGSGISKLCGFPLWNELGNNLLDICVTNGYLTRYTAEQYKKDSTSPMKKVSIACQIMDDNKHPASDEICKIFNKSYIDNSFSTKQIENFDSNKQRLINIFEKLRCKIITTNVDDVLDDCSTFNKPGIIYNLEKKVKGILTTDYPCIVHIHGSIKDKNNMVFTASDYAKKYNETSFIESMDDVLNGANLTFLFLGYSLEEFEIIRIIVKNSGSLDRFFVYNGYYFDNEQEKIKCDEKYFKSINVKLIPFDLSNNGYKQLIIELENLVNDLKDSSHLITSLNDTAANLAKNDISDYSKSIVKKEWKDISFRKSFIYSLNKSDYIQNWIPFLVDETDAFDPIINFFNCNDEEWLALYSLHYSMEKIKTKASRNAVLKILQKFVNIMDCENSYDEIMKKHRFKMIRFLNLYFEFPECFKDDSFKKFITIYCSLDIENIGYTLQKLSKQVNLCNQDAELKNNCIFALQKCLEISIKRYDKNSLGRVIHFLREESIEQILKFDADAFFIQLNNLLIYCLEEDKYECFTIGSFYACPRNQHYYGKIQILTKLIKSLVNEASKSLKLEYINRYLKEDNRHLLKAAIYYISSDKEFIIKYLNGYNFFNRKYAICDLIYLLKDNANLIEKEEGLLNKILIDISNITFASTDTYNNEIKNLIYSFIEDTFNINLRKTLSFNKVKYTIDDFEKISSAISITSGVEEPISEADKHQLDALSFKAKWDNYKQYKESHLELEYKKYRYLNDYFWKNKEEIIQNREIICKFDENDLMFFLNVLRNSQEINHEDISKFLNYLIKNYEGTYFSNSIFIEFLSNTLTVENCNDIDCSNIDLLAQEALKSIDEKMQISGFDLINNPLPFVYNYNHYFLMDILLKSGIYDKDRKQKIINYFENHFPLTNNINKLCYAALNTLIFDFDKDWFIFKLADIYMLNDGSPFIASHYNHCFGEYGIYEIVSSFPTFNDFILSSQNSNNSTRSDCLPSYAELITYMYLENREGIQRLKLFKKESTIALIIDILFSNVRKIDSTNNVYHIYRKKLDDYISYLSSESFVIKDSDNSWDGIYLKLFKIINNFNDIDCDIYWELAVKIRKIVKPEYYSTLNGDIFEKFINTRANYIIEIFKGIITCLDETGLTVEMENIVRIFKVIEGKIGSKANRLRNKLIQKCPYIAGEI